MCTAFVHYFTKRGFGEVYFFQPHEVNTNADPAASQSKEGSAVGNKVHPQEIFSVENHFSRKTEAAAAAIQIQSEEEDEVPSSPAILHETNMREAMTLRQRRPSRWDGIQMNSVSKIDKVSRVVFPLLFVAINFFYWYNYI